MIGKGNRRAPGRATGGRYGTGDAAERLSHSQHTTNDGDRQEAHAPLGVIPAKLEDGLISIGGRHVARIRNGCLCRTLDLQRETMRGALMFRNDVLHIAVKAGARMIECTDRATGTVYQIGMDVFKARGWAYTHPTYGVQWGCDLRHWSHEEPARQVAAGTVAQGMLL